MLQLRVLASIERETDVIQSFLFLVWLSSECASCLMLSQSNTANKNEAYMKAIINTNTDLTTSKRRLKVECGLSVCFPGSGKEAN